MGKKWYEHFIVTGDAAADPAIPETPPADEMGRAAPSVPAPRRASATRVAEAIPAARGETTFSTPVANPTAFEEIYRSAKILTPAHGYNILKIAEMLQSEHIRALPADVKRKSILVALDAAGIPIREVVEDAVRRDRALDTYERVLQKHLEDLRAQKDVENQRLEEEISRKLAELRARVETNNKEVAQEQDNLLAWRTKKHQEEERIAEAVGYFVAENPITAAGRPASPANPKA